MMLLSLVGLLLVGGVQAMYDRGSGVVDLTPENFEKKVLKGDGVWLVEFYAPWCGHCRNLVPEYSKAARALKGVVNVGAVDVDKHQSLGAPYGIQGFPTIKLFGADKKKPIDYNSERTAKGMVEAALREARNAVMARMGGKGGGSSSSSSSGGSGGKKGGSKGAVVELTDDNFDELVMQSGDVWMVEFFAPWCGHCKNLEPKWAAAASELQGTVKLGAVDATVHQQLAGKYGIRGYPTIKVFGANKNAPEDYQGGRETDDIVAYAKDLAGRSAPPPEVTELVSAAVWDEECAGKGRICIVNVLPHILDSSAKERRAAIKMLQGLAAKHKARPFRWLWTEAGKQPDVEAKLDLGGAGFPALAAVSVGKEKVANMRQAYDEQHINLFLGGLLTGKEPLGPLRVVPKIDTVPKWDGKDGVLPTENDAPQKDEL